MTVRRLIERQRRALASTHDAGFTMIEILVAMMITVVIMAALLGVLVSSLKTVAQAKQRQTATALATRSLEQLRALSYDAVTGLDLAIVPNAAYVTGSSPNYTFTPPASILVGISEPLVVNANSGTRLAPSPVLDNVTYTVDSYVTKAALTAAGQQAYNLTTIVSWTSTVFPTVRTIAERSTTFSPSGCLSTAQRPFSAPCQAYFTAQSGQSAAGFSVTNADDSRLDILGIGGKSVELSLPGLNANLQIEQTASGSASGTTSGAKAIPGLATGVGSQSAAVVVDSDPSSTPGQSITKSAIQTPGSVSLTGPGGTLTAKPTSSDSVGARAAIQADTGMCIDGTLTGTGLSTGATSATLRPCASANQKQASTAGEITYLDPLASNSISIMSLAAPSQTSRAVAANLAVANTDACSSSLLPTAPGCAHARVYRSLGKLVVGSLSGISGPLDVDKGVFSVSGLIDGAVVESGKGWSAPKYERAGQLVVWTTVAGVPQYQTVDLGDYAEPATGLMLPSQTWTIPPVTTTYSSGLSVTAEGSVTVQRPTLTTSGLPDCLTSACVARLNGGGGLRALTTFTVAQGATVLTKFVLVSEIGGAVAESTYKAAPSG